VGRQIVKALQVSNLPLRIIVTDASPFAFGLTEADKAYLVPRGDDADYIDAVLEICERESVQFLAPGSEVEIEEISEQRSRFETLGIRLLINNPEVINLCRDKWRTFEFLRDNGFNFAQSWLIGSNEDLKQVKTFPVVVKPALHGGGSRYVYVARDSYELAAFTELLIRDRLVTMVQEYLGTYNDEYTVGVLSTPQGEIVGSIALQRLLQDAISTKLRVPSLNSVEPLVISSGFSQGIIQGCPEVQKTCEAIAARLGSSGPLNVQCRKTERGVIAFEINPRLSGTTSIRALVGFNEPEILIRYFLTGEFPQAISYRTGYVLRELREKFVPFGQARKFSKTSFSET
jgi:carbamoyl-phosphate synthase large subunit